MKLRTFFLVIATILLASCTNSRLELKSKSELQELNQISPIGNAIGETAPDFTIITTDGRAVRLSSFAEQKKPVIVYFMATWCPYCAEDYAELSKVYPKYEKNVSFISIDLDLSEDILLLQEYKKKYPELQSSMFAPGQYRILSDYQATKTTTKYAIGRDGKIIYAGFGAFDEQNWKDLLEKLSEGS